MLNFIYSFFNQPAIVIGVVALIGLLSLKKPIDQVVSGTLKTVIGFVILSSGGSIISQSLANLTPAFESAFHVRGVVVSNEAVIGVAQNLFGSEMALIMAFGFLCNVALARLTKFKYIFLSGHHILFMSALLAAVLSAAGFTGAPLIIVGSLLLGSAMTLCPAVVQPFYSKVTANNNVAMGHFNGVSYSLSALISKLVGDTSKSTEDVKIPKNLGFLKDNSITTGIVMIVLFVVTYLLADPSVTTELAGGDNIVMFAIMQGILFAGGFVVTLQGVRMILAEIVPAFKGISDKIVPEAVPALDVPVLFPFAPNAVLIGFVTSLIGGMLVFVILPFTGLPVVIPGLVNLFFVGAGVGVLANAVGGVRGTIFAGLFNGAFITLLPAICLPVLGQLGFADSTFGDADFALVGITVGQVANYFAQPGVIALTVIVIAGFFIGSLIKTKRAN